MKELDKLLESIPIDELLEYDFSKYTEDEIEYLFKRVDNIADDKAYAVGIDYNIRDVQLVDRINEETGLLDLALTLAYKAGVNYSDTMGTTALWESLINRYLTSHKIVSVGNSTSKKTPYEGGYVKSPRVGMSKSIASFDLASLYPNILVQYGMSPETIVSGNIDMPNGVDHYLDNATGETEYAVAANGVKFRKDKEGVLPSIIKKLYDERKTIKDEMLALESKMQSDSSHTLKMERTKLHNRQMAIKLAMNSLYGSLASQYFRYFDLRIAEAVTLTGQLTIRWAEKRFNEYMNKTLKTKDEDYVIAIDTDSLYVDLSAIVKAVGPSNEIDFLSKVCKEKIEPVFKRAFDDLFDHMNATENRMSMKREVLADCGIWAAKKRYILNVWDKEGVRYTSPKLKIMGLEAIKSSTPQVVKSKFREAFNIMLSGTQEELQKFIQDFKKEFTSLPAEDVSFPRGISDIDKWKDPVALYKKGCPIHVRGAIIYNNLLKTKGLDRTHEEIKNGSKIKFCYLKMPNPTMENVLSFEGYLPREFDIEEFIDYETQFNKTFADPLRLVTNSIGWTLEKTATLEDLFS